MRAQLAESMPRASLLLLFACAANAQPFAPDYRADANLHVAAIRQEVLARPTFSKIVAPTSNRSETGTSYSDSGTDVFMQIRFFKVQAVAASEGAMRLKIWFRLWWKDTRLAWNASEHGGVSTVYYQADQIAGGEENEIWLPDVQVYNAQEGMVHTLDPALARVSSDGSVYYSRPGTLDVMCKFSGLVAFPRDSLRCGIEIGGWILGGGQQGLHLRNQGYAFSNQETTSGTSYQEYEIKAVNVSLTLYEYACCPSDPFPVAVYRITLNRARGFYEMFTIFPGILMTILAFVVFWTPTDSSDALGYGISVIVVNVLMNVVLVEVSSSSTTATFHLSTSHTHSLTRVLLSRLADAPCLRRDDLDRSLRARQHDLLLHCTLPVGVMHRSRRHLTGQLHALVVCVPVEWHRSQVQYYDGEAEGTTGRGGGEGDRLGIGRKGVGCGCPLPSELEAEKGSECTKREPAVGER